MLETLRWKIAQRAERIWWKSYLKNKDTTEYLIWKKKYWQTILDKYSISLKINSSDLIMDCGCGPAGVFMNFPTNEVYAFDPLLNMYEKDLRHFNKDMYPYVHFENESIESYKATKNVNHLFCMNAINHVKNIHESYDKLSTFLKPEGYIYITIDAHNFSIYRKIFSAIPGDILHPHQYNLQEYKDFLTLRNFEIMETHLLEEHYFFNHYLLIAKKR
jgi:2-polyprenyl-6-hydroxyphenyl methylase/3-demethylubiquinone-9 3-methyltransferase